MRSRLSLLFAAAMVAFSMQTAMALDYDDIDLDDIDIEEVEIIDDDDAPMMMHRSRMYRPDGDRDGFRRGRGPGSEHRWGGGSGHAPGMRRHGPPMGHRGPDMGRGDKGMFGLRFMDRLQLDEAQKTKIVDILTNAFRERLVTGMEIADAHKRLRDIRASDASGHDAIVAANQELGAAKGRMEIIGRKMRQEIRAVLTPDQIQKLDEMDMRRPRPDRDRKWDGKKDGKWDGKRDGKHPDRRGSELEPKR